MVWIEKTTAAALVTTSFPPTATAVRVAVVRMRKLVVLHISVRALVPEKNFDRIE